ncbi:hypothetical protein GCM10007877_05490 [Marinibactrum halimedae]|uniref:Uncharacterized protein n=1 Tax=Marinibactrum halimedae TaxID=1444977 RepID=A0AA37T7S1_9GAMM|nr:hypothetical protein GCM10007877_05490 [Marinibactrum halimedae]
MSKEVNIFPATNSQIRSPSCNSHELYRTCGKVAAYTQSNEIYLGFVYLYVMRTLKMGPEF